MNNYEQTQSSYELFLPMVQKMMTGQLNEQETEQLLELIEQSDENLETADAVWAEHLATLNNAPALKSQDTQRLAQLLARRIHRSDLSGQIVKIGTQGFTQVALALLRPFFGGTPWQKGQQEDGQ